MDNFLKQFRDNLDNQPEPRFEEKDWQALAKRLPAQKDKRPLSILLLWGLLPLFLLSMGSNAFLYQKMNNAQQQTDLINSRLDSVWHKTIVYQTDTIYRIRTIVEHDTFYKYNHLKETNLANLNSNLDGMQKQNSNNLIFNNKQNSINLNFNSIKNNTKDNKQDAVLLNLKDNKNDSALFLFNLEKLKLISIPFLKLNKIYQEPEIGDLPIVLNTHKTLQQRIAVLKPKSYSLGASAGLTYPLGTGLSQPSGYLIGANGAMSFSPNISAWADIQYQQLVYNVGKMSDAIGVPVMSPPNNQFGFSLATLKKPSVQYVAGLRYYFDHKKHWQPYLGVGFGATTLLPYEVGYEFKNNALGTVWDIDLKVKQQGTQFGFLLLDGGIEKRLSNQYRWQLGASYRLKLASDVQKYRVLSLRTGILFDF